MLFIDCLVILKTSLNVAIIFSAIRANGNVIFSSAHAQAARQLYIVQGTARQHHGNGVATGNPVD